MLSNLILNAGQLSGISIPFKAVSEDAQKILAEATAVTEKRTGEKLPDLTVSTEESIALPNTDSDH